MPRKPPPKKDVVVPCRYLADARSNEHRNHVSQALDSEAIDNARAALVSRGHAHGRSIYLWPYREPLGPDAPVPFVPLQQPLSPEMRLLFASRPPIFEDKEAYPKIRKPSYHELEYALNGVWRPFFEWKRRDGLVLSSVLADHLPHEFADRKHIEFGKREGSFYRRLMGSDRRLPPEPRACGFVLNSRRFHHGTSLTSFFAMDGVACLILSTLIAERHPGWLDEPGVRMVEMIGTPIPPSYEGLGFVDDWEILSLLHVQA